MSRRHKRAPINQPPLVDECRIVDCHQPRAPGRLWCDEHAEHHASLLRHHVHGG